MQTTDPFAAELLETSATGYGGAAASLLIERHPDVRIHDGPVALERWRSHYVQRLLELATALRLGEPEIFLERVRWMRKAYRAREVSDHDLSRSLQCLRDVLEDRLPDSAKALVGAWMDRALQHFEESLESVPRGLDPDRDPDRLALRYLLTVLEGDVRRATDLVLHAVDGGLSVESAYLDVLLPAQREIGRMWHLGDTNVAEEHLVTTTTQRLMALLSQKGDVAPPNGRTVVAAAVEGNEHDMAVRALCELFSRAGWRAICLGADLPASDLCEGLVFFDGDLLVLSVTLGPQLRAAQETVEAVRRLEGPRVPVLVGGEAFAAAPEAWRAIGADACAGGLGEALDVAARLVEANPR